MQFRSTTAQVVFLGQAASEPTRLLIPIMGAMARLGFPSPADDFIEDTLDLNTLLIRNPPATFFYRAVGDSMTGAGVCSGDILIVDRSVTIQNGDKVLATWGGESPVCKIIRGLPDRILLYSANPDFPVLVPPTDVEVELYAVVGVVRQEVRGRKRRVRPR
jgi:DNA polymerase V